MSLNDQYQNNYHVLFSFCFNLTDRIFSLINIISFVLIIFLLHSQMLADSSALGSEGWYYKTTIPPSPAIPHWSSLSVSLSVCWSPNSSYTVGPTSSKSGMHVAGKSGNVNRTLFSRVAFSGLVKQNFIQTRVALFNLYLFTHIFIFLIFSFFTYLFSSLSKSITIHSITVHWSDDNYNVCWYSGNVHYCV